MNNNKRRRHDSEVDTIKQDCPNSPDVGPTDKSGPSAISPQSSQKFKNGGEHNRPLTTTEAEYSAIRKKLFAQYFECSPARSKFCLTLRSKGERKMIVEHVHVHNGGQAIIGHQSEEQNGQLVRQADG